MHGFILSQHWQDTADGLTFRYWVSTEDGAQCLSFTQQEAIVFCRPQDAPLIAELEGIRLAETHLKHFSQNTVTAVYCNRYQALSAVRRFCRERDLPLWEAEIKPTERFMMERFIRGSLEWANEQSNSSQKRNGIASWP